MSSPPGAQAAAPRPGEPSDAAVALRLRGICKRFGAVVANDDISLDLQPGEVLALLGENGAGKSTLVSILFGHYLADSGTIEVFGRRLPPGQPKAALAAGVGMVHQHFSLAENMSVLDNVMLGTEPLWRPLSRRAAARARLLQAAQDFGLQVHPQALVGELSVGERQRVEILKALVRGARILILDEPTAVLTPQEADSLFLTLAQMVARGLSIIFISHKLDEVLRVSDRIAVLRGGRLVAVLPAAGASRSDLAQAMVGRDVAPVLRPPSARATAEPDERAEPARVCELRSATVRTSTGQPLLDGANLQVRAGEIVAVAGVAGNGQAALAEVLCGQRRLDHGELRVVGQPMPASAREAVRRGVARIPEDRQSVGVVGELPLWENVVLEHYAQPAFSRGGLMRRLAAREHARRLLSRYDVRGTESAGVDTPTRALSGGNMQKLILGRALSGSPNGVPPLVVACQPTWGLDVGAVAYVHQQLLDACAAGAGVVLISEDLDEIFALADRIAVMQGGRLSPARDAAQWTLATIGLAMAGSAPEPAHAA